jgi:hypothetical protein
VAALAVAVGGVKASTCHALRSPDTCQSDDSLAVGGLDGRIVRVINAWRQRETECRLFPPILNAVNPEDRAKEHSDNQRING